MFGVDEKYQINWVSKWDNTHNTGTQENKSYQETKVSKNLIRPCIDRVSTLE